MDLSEFLARLRQSFLDTYDIELSDVILVDVISELVRQKQVDYLVSQLQNKKVTDLVGLAELLAAQPSPDSISQPEARSMGDDGPGISPFDRVDGIDLNARGSNQI